MDGHLSQEIFEAIWILVCLFMSSFFSGSETSITAFGQLKAQHLVEQRKGKNSKHLILWMKHPARILSTILLFNNIFNIAASAQATVIATRYFESQAVGIATGITTFLVLVFGEIVPKSFARAHYERGYHHILAKLTADACIAVCPKNPHNFRVDDVRVAKVVGSGLASSEIIAGLVIRRAPDVHKD